MHAKAKISTAPFLRGLVQTVKIRMSHKVTSLRESHCSECPFRAESTFDDTILSTMKQIVESHGKREGWTYTDWLKYLISLVSAEETPFACHQHSSQFCKGASLVQPLVNVSNLPILNEENK